MKRVLVGLVMALGLLGQETTPGQNTGTSSGGGGDATEATLASRLGEATYTGRTGEVQASPTAYTVLGRLKTIEDALASLLTELGQKTEPANTQTISGAVTGPVTDTQLRATPVPVSGTFYQATQPVSAAALPLPTGASTSAKQDTEISSLASIDGKITAVNTGAVVVSSSALPSGASTSVLQTTGNSSLSSIDGKLPALGQALAAASVPVVLPAAQLSTLTPLSSVAVTNTGTFATQASQAGTWNIGTVTTLPSITGTVTANAGTNLNTSALALESGGNLATIVTNTGRIPAQGQALAAASLPVVLTAAQVATLTPPTSITVTQGTGTNLHTVVDSGAVTATLNAETTKVIGTVNVSSGQTIGLAAGTAAIGKLAANSGVTIGAVEIAAAQTLGTVTTVGSVTSITNALPAGTNAIGKLAANSGVDIGDVDPSTPASWAIGATAATAPANASYSGAVGKSAQPTAVTDGQLVGQLASLDGALYTRPGGPILFSCGVTAIGTTLTQCQAAPSAGLSLYITDVVTQSNTSTAGLFTLRFGTGTNCGTGTGNLFFGSASALMASPANTVAVNHFHLTTPIKVTAANAICVLGVVTNTTNAQITGFTAP